MRVWMLPLILCVFLLGMAQVTTPKPNNHFLGMEQIVIPGVLQPAQPPTILPIPTNTHPDILKLTLISGDILYVRCRDVLIVEDFARGNTGKGTYVTIVGGRYIEVREPAAAVIDKVARHEYLSVEP